VGDGEPFPKEWSERIDEATPGSYALYPGDGYMIHGTPWQHSLGRPVTPGRMTLPRVVRSLLWGRPLASSVTLLHG
jgi:hypothetical protein